MKKSITLAVLALTALLTGCATPSYDYTAFRESKPRSILVLPPVNESLDVSASYSFPGDLYNFDKPLFLRSDNKLVKRFIASDVF